MIIFKRCEVDKTKVYKEKQYLIFDFEDGRTVKYDFATKSAIGIKGKPVRNLCGQLSGMTMTDVIECCSDPKYANFLKFVQKQYPYYISNIGTILAHVPEFARFEQIFSAGIDEIINFCQFKGTIDDIPKSMLKIARNRNIKISDNTCSFWRKNPNAHCIGYAMDYISLDDNDLFYIWASCTYDYDRNRHIEVYHSYFNDLIEQYGYNAKSLFQYVDTLKTYEAIEDMSYLMRELCDYASMMSTISTKYDKYPRHFLTTHRIAIRNYNRLKKEFIVLIDKEDLEKVKLLQWHVEYGKYVVHSHRENGKKKTIYLQRYILEVLDNQYIRFKNGNSLDCRKENLLVYEKRRAG